MGRTNPTYRDSLRRREAEWQAFRRALRRQHQPAFDRLTERAFEFADAAGYLNPHDPFEAVVLSILLSQELELRRLHDRGEDGVQE
jgi:hypothetical protein